MNSKRNVRAVLIVAMCIVAVAITVLRVFEPRGLPARVATADDREYYGVVYNLIASANQSIDVILYQSRFYFSYPLSESNMLLAALADAGERGVRVRAVLEQADWNLENSEDNRDVGSLLRHGGARVYFDPLTTTSHSKLAIVDGRYVIVGSSNWSHYALDVNNEANVVVDSDDIAREFRDYFEDLVQAGSTKYEAVATPLTAEGLRGWEGRNAVVADVADSGFYDAGGHRGLIYMKGITIVIEEGPLDEVIALDSVFFRDVAGDSLRALVRPDRHDPLRFYALDVENPATSEAMARAFDAERAAARGTEVPAAGLRWFEAARVTPAPNEVYGRELRRLIAKAKQRIWIAMLDARYYDETPRTARKSRAAGDAASFTNLLLDDLIDAAQRGVEVKMVSDMGWSGGPPRERLAFLDKLKAGGGMVFEDPEDITTHAKVMIIDDDYAVVGSTNWSYHALEENNETAVIIKSPGVNDHYAHYIQAIMDRGRPYGGAGGRGGSD